MNRSTKVALTVGSIVVALFVALPLVWARFPNWYGGGCIVNWPWMMGGFGWWGWWMMIPMILFWAFVIWGVVYLVSRVASPGVADTRGRANSALEVLKVRYARGEIGKEEYEEKRRGLA